MKTLLTILLGMPIIMPNPFNYGLPITKPLEVTYEDTDSLNPTDSSLWKELRMPVKQWDSKSR